jgi:hypothetical protein
MAAEVELLPIVVGPVVVEGHRVVAAEDMRPRRAEVEATAVGAAVDMKEAVTNT